MNAVSVNVVSIYRFSRCLPLQGNLVVGIVSYRQLSRRIDISNNLDIIQTAVFQLAVQVFITGCNREACKSCPVKAAVAGIVPVKGSFAFVLKIRHWDSHQLPGRVASIFCYGDIIHKIDPQHCIRLSAAAGKTYLNLFPRIQRLIPKLQICIFFIRRVGCRIIDNITIKHFQIV